MTKITALPLDSAPQPGDYIPTIDVTDTTTKKTTLSTLTPMYNPYKFSAYRNAALTPGTADIIFDTELFDTNSNFDTTTGKYTAPISGFYQFNANITLSTAAANLGYATAIKKNGTIVAHTNAVMMYSGAYSHGFNLSTLLQLVAGDYITVNEAGNSGRPIVVGAAYTFFNGFLVSRT